jgi:uncharacterized membrane protein
VATRLRLFGHPLHPMSVHLPIGLLAASTLFDFLGLWSAVEQAWHFSLWCLGLGLAGGVAAVVTGLLDYATLPRGHRAETPATWHLSVMLAALAAYGVRALLSFAGDSPGHYEPAHTFLAAGLSLVGVVLLGLGGWLGGQLVYRYGVGFTEPEKEEE